MLEANYLSILLKPNYGKAVDTPQDVLDRGLTVIGDFGGESMVETMKNSPVKFHRELAEMTIVAKVIFRSFEIILILNFLKRIMINKSDG